MLNFFYFLYNFQPFLSKIIVKIYSAGRFSEDLEDLFGGSVVINPLISDIYSVGLCLGISGFLGIMHFLSLLLCLGMGFSGRI